MSNPNIAGSSTTIYGNTTYYTPSGTSAVVLLTNAASSNSVAKVNQIVAANVTSSAATATVSIYTNGAVAQGSAPAGGTAYPIAYQISVPPNASLVVVDKTSALYLMENTCISITSGTGSAITYSISYELIS
jgi:hypothetical protein